MLSLFIGQVMNAMKRFLLGSERAQSEGSSQPPPRQQNEVPPVTSFPPGSGPQPPAKARHHSFQEANVGISKFNCVLNFDSNKMFIITFAIYSHIRAVAIPTCSPQSDTFEEAVDRLGLSFLCFSMPIEWTRKGIEGLLHVAALLSSLFPLPSSRDARKVPRSGHLLPIGLATCRLKNTSPCF